jgi:hypothetical protein
MPEDWLTATQRQVREGERRELAHEIAMQLAAIQALQQQQAALGIAGVLKRVLKWLALSGIISGLLLVGGFATAVLIIIHNAPPYSVPLWFLLILLGIVAACGGGLFGLIQALFRRPTGPPN